MTPPLALVVDDESVFLEIVSARLRASGFSVETFSKVTDALSKVQELRPDIVISDICMPPGPNGWDFAIALHDNPATRGIPVALLTSLRDPAAEFPGDRAEMATLLKTDTILSKTDDMESLGETALKIIRRLPS